MRKFLKGFIVLLTLTLISCSKDDSSANIKNGFLVGNTFFETDQILAEKCCTVGSGLQKYSIDIFTLDENNANGNGYNQFDHLASFYLYTGDEENLQLVSGTYTTNNSAYNSFVIDGHDYIEFRDNALASGSRELASSPGWYNDNTFQSGSVTINSITSELNEYDEYIVTHIDLDYKFRIDNINVVGNYSGPVELSDPTDSPY
ncbi:hypothetical protein [Salegentibacter chungangensis]|uniref:Lipoprotein n=1 Tax=Salegentibacter chungangensis TaxID=1335724 RepID=A0ABW3NS68_9FLAO